MFQLAEPLISKDKTVLQHALSQESILSIFWEGKVIFYIKTQFYPKYTLRYFAK